MEIIDFVLHIDKHLEAFISSYGTLVYLLLFLIVFCETGLVVTPFLPGDSLLFAAGALAANPINNLNVGITRCCNNYGPRQFPEKIIPLNTALFPPAKLTDPYYD
jgi:hypothetical protein